MRHHHHKPLPRIPSLTSIGFTQPASQLNHDGEERRPLEHATIHSRVMNAPAFGDPITPSIAITTATAAPAPPAESGTTRCHPLSGDSTTTIRYSVATSHLHTQICIPLHMGGSGAVVTKETQVNGQGAKAKDDDKFSVARSGSSEHGPSRMRCSKMKICTRITVYRPQSGPSFVYLPR
jgi:hypothetical protein